MKQEHAHARVEKNVGLMAALVALVISFGGKWLGRSINKAGYTDDTTVHEVGIGNDVVSGPANAIPFARAACCFRRSTSRTATRHGCRAPASPRC